MSRNRYSKQINLAEIGMEGQEAIRNASVLCVGAGGLSAPVLLYLAAAGVGRIGIVDDDEVELSNLQRQVLFQQKQMGTKKVESARGNLEQLNADVLIETYGERLSVRNVEKLFRDYDVIVDGTDNFETKFLINDAAVKFGKPVIFGTVTGWEGQASIFDASRGPCYRCVYPDVPSETMIPNCAESGVLGAVVGIVGSVQATECLKWIVYFGAKSKQHENHLLSPLIGRIFSLDARDLSVSIRKISKNNNCSVCSIDLQDIDLSPSVEPVSYVLANEVEERPQDYFLIDVREADEWNEFHLEGAVHAPLSLMKAHLDFSGIEALLKSKRKGILYCASGKRSAEAVSLLKFNGFGEVYSLKSGISSIARNGWKAPAATSKMGP